jgi:DNA-binding transcriptional MerR regulator
MTCALTDLAEWSHFSHLRVSVSAIRKATETIMTKDVLTISEMCAAFEVTPRALRFYETKALLSPIRQGTKRLYTRRDRARLTLILRGKRFGFSLEDIGELLDLYDRDGNQERQLTRTYDLAQVRLGQMERQRAELDVLITELKKQLAWGDTVLAGLHKEAAE